ncbi:hypothetical protein LPN04_31385 [Rugamonas sp. A1-17]|nr:hypothetical protein [Rugamonas sp. A1-17]
MKNIIVVTVLVAAAVANAAQGADMLSVEDRKSVLEAQLELLRKEGELNTALRAAAGSNARALPTVLSVSVVGANRTAFLQMPNGGTEHFKVGDEIQSNVVLASADLRKVVVLLRQGKKSVPIVLDSANPLAQSGSNGNQQPDPNRQLASIPLSLLPPPPVVQVPSMNTIRGAGSPLPIPTVPSSPVSATPPKN